MVAGCRDDLGLDGHPIPLVQGIVQTTGVANGLALIGEDANPGIALAMHAAAEKAIAEGISDPDVIRILILEARNRATSET